ncbi:MAG: hypothetical protein IJZ39_07050 [Oscillospiraceae bacterium]|nr:hypothetical protein [Oscillospiraceae bacterium]
MSNKTALFGAFVAGAATGALATYKFVKDKYEKLAKEEAESFAAKLKELRQNEVTPLPTEPESEEKKDIPQNKSSEVDDSTKKSYEKFVSNLGYTDYSAISQGKPVSQTEPVPVDLPQVIDPDEIGEYDDYRVITLLYFADHILADHDGNIVSREEANELLGPDALDRFGEYEEDAVHVRNDARKCYYEVLMEGRLYSDLLRKKPYLMSDDDEDEED